MTPPSTTLNKALFDSAVELGIDINAISIGVRGDVVRMLEVLEKELIAKVAAGSMTDWNKARIAKQLSEAQTAIRGTYTQIAGLVIDKTSDVAQVSATATAEALSLSTGGAIAGVMPTAPYLESIASNAVIQGAAQGAWWAKQAEDTVFRFSTAVRQGLVAGETRQQITSRVQSAMNISKTNATTLVRTSVQTVANEVRDKTFGDNSDIIASKEWISTLDSRTCIVCGSLDGKRWDLNFKPIGHKTPYTSAPAHFNCRCTFVPVLKGFDEIGVDLSKLPPASRASANGVVKDKTFATWLKEQPTGDAHKILGKARTDLFQSGKLTIDQLLNGSKPLTVAELSAKYVSIG